MIDALVGVDGAGAPAPPGHAPPPLEREAAGVSEVREAPEDAAPSEAPDGSPEGPAVASPPPPPPPPPPHRAVTLRVDEDEAQAMRTLSWLVTRSPRSTKRFVNTYRLFKATLRDEEAERFAARREHREVLLLLGLVTGAPTVSVEVLARVRSQGEGPDLLEIVESAAGRSSVAASDRDRARRALRAVRDATWQLDPAVARRWAPRVAQFSFTP